jgi:multiple antibiotic resistance protein
VSDSLSFAILSFVSLFIIIDPVGVIPSLIAMTRNNSQSERVKMARTACIATFLTLFLFLLAGQYIFKFFSITLPAFQIAGGIVLMIIALDMLQARRTGLKESDEETSEGTFKDDIAITPLAIPMLAGPGAMTTIILLSSNADSWFEKGLLAGDLALVCVFTFLILRYASINVDRMHVIALKITTRIMGLILAAVSVQFIIDGVKEVLWH